MKITNHKDGSFERLPGESLTEWTQRWLTARQQEALWFRKPHSQQMQAILSHAPWRLYRS